MLRPGEEDVEFEIYRCAQCLRLKPWENGGGSATELELGADEVEHLEDCCDDCWCKIIPPLEQAYARTKGDVMSEAIDLKRLVDKAYNTGFRAGLQSIIDVIDIAFTQPVHGEYLKDSLLYVYIKQQLQMMGPNISDRDLDITMALLKEVPRGGT